MMRLFVAAFPPRTVVNHLERAVATVAGEVPARAICWTRAEQIHLTLFFLGSIEASRVAEIQLALSTACAGQKRLSVRVAGLGCFPEAARPRILWAGLAGELQPLKNLQASVDAAMRSCGCRSEERAFHPHLTAGRVAQINRPGIEFVKNWISQNNGHDFGEWEIQNVCLMRSVMDPAGAVYSLVHSINLEGGPGKS